MYSCFLQNLILNLKSGSDSLKNESDTTQYLSFVRRTNLLETAEPKNTSVVRNKKIYLSSNNCTEIQRGVSKALKNK